MHVETTLFQKKLSGGLAPIANAEGTLIAFATSSGSVASDNPMETNGLYTKYLLKALDKPLNQRELFHQVRKNVYEASNKTQRAYLNDGTIGDFFFTSPQVSKKDNFIIKKAFLKNNFLGLYEKDYYFLSVDIQNISAKDIAITSSDVKIKYSDNIKINNDILSSGVFSKKTVNNDPIIIKPKEVKRITLENPLYIKGLKSNLDLNGEFYNYQCVEEADNTYDLPVFHNAINFDNQTIFTVNIFTHNKFLEFSTKLTFGNDYQSNPDKIINHEKTVGQYIYVYNRQNNKGYQKKVQEKLYYSRSCLPEKFSEREDWSK